MHAEEAVQREGTKLASRQEFAKRVALDLFRFMESFNKGVQGDMLVLPTNCLELWFQKFDSKFRRQVSTAASKPPLLCRSMVAEEFSGLLLFYLHVCSPTWTWQNAGGGWSLSDFICIMVGEHAVHVQEPRVLDAER